MSLPTEAYKAKSGPCYEALDRASLAIDRFRHGGGNETAAAELQGWVYVDLSEQIATALLEEQGFDLKRLDEVENEMRIGDAMDLFASWERGEIARLGWKPREQRCAT